MKNSSNISKRQRMVFHSFMLLEQVLGNRLFQLILPLKKRFLVKLLSELEHNHPEEVTIIDSKTDLSPEEFEKFYFNQSTPIIFKGAAKEWGCCQKWNLDYFSFGYGEKDLLLVNAEGLTSREKNNDYEI